MAIRKHAGKGFGHHPAGFVLGRIGKHHCLGAPRRRVNYDERSIGRPGAAELHWKRGQVLNAFPAETCNAPIATLQLRRGGIESKIASSRQVH
jgi:hypothetical protein